MSKTKHTIIALAALLLILFGVIYGLGNINAGALDNDITGPDTPPPPPPFEFISANPSETGNVVFENNFGGTSEDEVVKTYKTDYYYVLGNTTSKDKYFEKNKQTKTVFVVKMNESGSAITATTMPVESVYIDSYLAGSAIYILIQSAGNACLYSFNTITGTVGLLLTLTGHTPLHVIENNDIEVLTSLNGKLALTSFNPNNSQFSTNVTESGYENIKVFAPYKTGAVVMTNTSTGVLINYLSKATSTELCSNLIGFTLVNFCITETGYFLLLKNTDGFFYAGLSDDFSLLFLKSAVNASSATQLAVAGDFIYNITPNSGKLTLNIVCGHGDFFYSAQKLMDVNKVLFVRAINDRVFVMYQTIESNLGLVYFDKLCNIESITSLNTGINLNPKSLEQTFDGNFMLFGNNSTIGSLVTRHFGLSDVFALKINANWE